MWQKRWGRDFFSTAMTSCSARASLPSWWDWAKQNLKGRVGSFVEAAKFGELVVLNPQYKGGKPTIFICGNDEAAKTTVRGILDQFGWEPRTWAGPKQPEP